MKEVLQHSVIEDNAVTLDLVGVHRAGPDTYIKEYKLLRKNGEPCIKLKLLDACPNMVGEGFVSVNICGVSRLGLTLDEYLEVPDFGLSYECNNIRLTRSERAKTLDRVLRSTYQSINFHTGKEKIVIKSRGDAIRGGTVKETIKDDYDEVVYMSVISNIPYKLSVTVSDMIMESTVLLS